ncbi:cell division protein ZapE [Shewanella waksmanii]|uniref:cell division protein ZapE n=1 Tax=Shewanella waksmanii TaxID=213783 RepID=UPI00048F607C|nr:cell division protein ZapE [Shewanella waksmanii]
MAASPLCHYQNLLDSKALIFDPAQQHAVQQLQSLFQQLQSQSQPVTGLYLWGDVGRGKTRLMDLFFHACQNSDKIKPQRLHFHRFMSQVHRQLNQYGDAATSIEQIASELALTCEVLCFDEFFVNDIGDAIILYRLFEALFQQGVVLVATSNVAVNQLYANGLQRERFLPCIDLIEKQTKSLHLQAQQDYRLRSLELQPAYFTDKQAFSRLFEQLNDFNHSVTKRAITVLDRQIDVIQRTTNILWVDFTALCQGPRSALDYIELANRYQTILLSHVPVLGGEPKSWIKARGTEDGIGATATGARQLAYALNDDPARRFIALVDELYDRQVNLYIQADVPLDELYHQGALSFEFRRTNSRLKEMQSSAYLAQAPKPHSQGD